MRVLVRLESLSALFLDRLQRLEYRPLPFPPRTEAKLLGLGYQEELRGRISAEGQQASGQQASGQQA